MTDKRTTMLAILAGGPLAGVLLAAALPPQLKPAADSPWRTAARERALEIDSYAFVDTSYAGSGPQAPWLQWMGPPRTAPFAEDFYRAQAIAISPDDYSMVQQANYEPEPPPLPEPRAEAQLAIAAEQADNTAEQLQPSPPAATQVEAPAEDEPPLAEADEETAPEAEIDFGG